ncbi:MAG: YDG domain-containing protein, partial [Eubacteriales bacterium]|nr:YDG domain-containing protein [Eubacteriales bacterium]
MSLRIKRTVLSAILVLGIFTLVSPNLIRTHAISDIEHDISLESLVISDNMTYIVSGTTTTNTITVSSGCSPTVWLNGVDIDVSAISDKSAFLIAEDSPGNVRIRIADNTANSLKSGTNKAGIEKSSSLGSEANMVGTLTIDGGLATNPNTGTLYAQGGLNAAGIGGGSQKSSGEIIINGGKLTTRSNGLNYNVGGGCAASIGGGGGGSLSPKYAKVTINGGYIDATTGSFSAVIGTGDWNANGSGIVAINGGYLYVNNQNGTTYNYYAIGGGYNSNGDVTITGGTIYNMNENPSYFIGASLVLVKNITGGSYNADVSQLLDATQYKCSYSVHSGLWTVLPNDMFILTCFMDGQYFESYGLQMGTSLDTIDEPEMAGYFFDGWYRNEGMTESISVMPSEDTVIYGAMIGKFIKLGEATDKSGYDYRYANASLKGDALTILNISVPTGYFKVTDTAVSGTQDYAAMTSAGVYSSTLSTSAQYKSLTLQGLFIDEDLQDFLRGLTFTMIPGVKQVVNASVFSNELNENMTVIVDPDGTAHYYEYFEGSISWEDAYNAAKTKRYNGLYGYLATITSSVEHDYIYKVLSGSGGWIGGMRVGNTYTGEYDTLTAGYNTGGSVSTSRYWYWTAGPEAGKRFFTQNISVGGGTNYTDDGLNYSNWNSGEPNAGGGTECYAQYGFGDSKLWNDLGTNYSGNIYGYYVEYSTYPIAGVVNEEEDKPFTATGFYGGSELILDADGGSVTPGSKEIVLGGVYGELPVPERAGYAFDGWFTTIGGSSQVSAATSVTDTDGSTAYAHWDLNAPSVTAGAGYSGVYDGSGHDISVVAGSQASVTYSYKWYKDGVLVAGEDGASLSLKNVADSGVYTCEVTISDGSDYASAASGEITVAITKRPVTYKADDKSVTYNGLAHSGSSVSVTAGSTASGDSIGSVTFSGSFVNAGEYSIGIDSIVLVDGDDNNVSANYEFGFVGGTLTIGRKSITVKSAVLPTVSKIYDGTVNGTSSVSPDDYTFVGLEAGDTLLLDFTAVFDGKNVLGASKVTLSGLGLLDNSGLADNYDLDTLTFDIAASILPAALNGFAANDDPRKVYDRTRFGVTTDIGFTGAIGSEQPVIKADLTFNSSSAGDGKTVTVNGFTLTWAGISEAQAEVNSNYVLASSSDIVYNTGIIDPKPLTDSDIAAGLSFANADYTGGYITPSALITFAAYTLNQYTDYVVV